ncbi:MAG: preprotein translocase subunit SecG [Candidatus Eremiobacteraeota bacterium]|nr:preprotein translocase subunit SecG [Candidatus Eremiobacteraeota bacterium]MBV8355202.1 preprotein translocase subunit SecG [Candidatus Eremiobacteraeota bacterium]
MIIAQILAAASAPAKAASAAASSAASTMPVDIQNAINAAAARAANPSRSPLALNYPWLTHILAAVFVIAAVLLIVLLALQTTKQEGLSGTIGGRVESAYRGRLAGDTQIARLTTYIALIFVLFGTLLSLSGI